MMLLTARYVAPVVGPVIEDGAVLVRSGRVVEVGPRSELSVDSVIDYGDAVICPGFVNAHTHLELSFLAGRIPPDHDFAKWIGRLVTTVRAVSDGVDSACRDDPEADDGKRSRATNQSRDQYGATHAPIPEDVLSTRGTNRSSSNEGAVSGPDALNEGLGDAVLDGIAQSIRAGVTLVGDITRSPDVVRPLLSASNLRSVSYGEVIAIGPQRDMLTERLENALAREHGGDRLRVGVSPHAPYTVEPEALTACARRASEAVAPLCIHLAESREEEAFTLRGTGPLAEHLKSLGAWDDQIVAAGRRPIELADACGVLTERTVVAHANYVTDADIGLLTQRGVSVAFCPRTHQAFGHEPHRFPDMLRAGVNVCIGTDSLASNPSLSVLDELRFLHRTHAGIDPELLLAMGTQHGAEALGWTESAGSITPGTPADLVVIPFEQSLRTAGVAAIFESDAPPRAVYISGSLQHPR